MGQRDLTESVLAAGVDAALVEMGFKRRGRAWSRRAGDVTYFINHQSLIAPPWISRARLEFAIAFRAIGDCRSKRSLGTVR